MSNTKVTPLGKLVVLVLLLCLGAIAGAAGATATRPHAQAWRCITVRPGDTLWGIAGANPAPDRRETVHRITEQNGLRTPPHAGAAVWIPNEGDLSGFLEADPAACPVPGPG